MSALTADERNLKVSGRINCAYDRELLIKFCQLADGVRSTCRSEMEKQFRKWSTRYRHILHIWQVFLLCRTFFSIPDVSRQVIKMRAVRFARSIFLWLLKSVAQPRVEDTFITTRAIDALIYRVPFPFFAFSSLFYSPPPLHLSFFLSPSLLFRATIANDSQWCRLRKGEREREILSLMFPNHAVF